MLSVLYITLRAKEKGDDDKKKKKMTDSQRQLLIRLCILIDEVYYLYILLIRKWDQSGMSGVDDPLARVTGFILVYSTPSLQGWRQTTAKIRVFLGLESASCLTWCGLLPCKPRALIVSRWRFTAVAAVKWRVIAIYRSDKGSANRSLVARVQPTKSTRLIHLIQLIPISYSGLSERQEME